jgi:hypothetical protein
VSAFSSADAGARTLRRRLFELNPPAFDFTLADEALTSGLTPGGREIVAALNDEQRAAVRLALAAKDYALIAGLPGAGKSATLAALVRAFVDVGKSVLITSHTHGAVDNVLARLPGVGVEDYVRVGGELGKASAETAKHTPGGERHGAKPSRSSRISRTRRASSAPRATPSPPKPSSCAAGAGGGSAKV